MLADFYIPRLSNDMKIAVQKNHLVGQILYRSLVPCKKTASNFFVGRKNDGRSSVKVKVSVDFVRFV